MKYQKSAFPYLALLLGLLVGIPFANLQLQNDQSIEVAVEVKHESPSTQTFANVVMEEAVLSTNP